MAVEQPTLPQELVALYLEFIQTGKNGSLTIHFDKGIPRKVERRDFENVGGLR